MEHGRGAPAPQRVRLANAPSPGAQRHDIIERSAAFCDRCLQAAISLKGNGVCYEIARQLTRCSGSVGANIEEAQGSSTKEDFAYKMSLALKEARETRFWLRRVFNNKLLKPQRLTALIQESEEIVAILTAIVSKSRDRKRSNKG